MWFKIDYCIFSFLSCLPFPLSFFLCFPFPLCSLPQVLFCSTKTMSSCTLPRIPNRVLRISGEHSLESYRCYFLPVSLYWLAPCCPPPPLFTLTIAGQCWCLSTDRMCGSLSTHLLRSLSGGQVSVPSFWKILPSSLEVDQSLLDSLKH